MGTDRNFRRILLIRRKALGDALVTMPAVQEVCAAWPEARIDLVIDRPFVPLFQGRQEGFQVLSWPVAADGSWVRALWQAEYDLVIDWLGSPRTALWTLLTGAPVRVGYDLPGRRWAYNLRVPRNRDDRTDLRAFAGESFLDPLRRLGLAPAPWRTGALAEDRTPEDAAFSAPYLQWRENWAQRPGAKAVLVMSATWPAKAWPAGFIGELAAGLAAAGWNPALAPGPGDEELIAVVSGGLAPGVLVPPTNLPELRDLISRAALFVGTDNGARHLAAGLGVSTVTLFGPTDAQGWNPAHPGHVSVRTGIACSPCDLTHCPLPEHPCMRELGPDMVLAAVARLAAESVDGKERP